MEYFECQDCQHCVKDGRGNWYCDETPLGIIPDECPNVFNRLDSNYTKLKNLIRSL